VHDFRTKLYQHYFSGYKATAGVVDPKRLDGYWAWCRVKLLPWFERLSRDAGILELGCGTGAMLAFLRREGFTNVRGIDVSAEMVAEARAAGLPATCDDASAFLAKSEGRYDAIVALDFVEHLTREELDRLLPRVHSQLVEGGMLVLQTPNGAGLMAGEVIHGDLTHMTVFTANSLRQLLHHAGFDRVEFKETGPAPVSLRGAARTVLWEIVKAMANAVKLIETGRRQAVWTENILCRCHKPDVGGR
jgi:SAM-dependent methyltransferase